MRGRKSYWNAFLFQTILTYVQIFADTDDSKLENSV